MTRHLVVALGIVVFAMLAISAYLGLEWAPREVMMGDVYRIMYVHVPCALMSLFACTICFGASLTYLLSSRPQADALAHASAEVGVFFATLLLITGSIWGRPTWGVYWTWDPRLTTAAILWLAFLGYLALRRFVEAPERRATWSAVVAVIISVDVPIVYYSVKWWNSLHQEQSTPKTVDPSMVLALRFAITTFFVAALYFMWLRYRSLRRVQEDELSAPPELATTGAAR